MNHKANLKRLHSGRIKETDSRVQIHEVTPEGSGTVTFDVINYSIYYQNKHNKPPVHWISQGKCADGAFIIFTEKEAHLHIVELKSKLAPKEWIKVCEQFEGMFLNSLAIAGIIELKQFDSITCYVAFTEDALSPARNASPIFYKHMPGLTPQRHNITEWLASVVTILSKYKANLVKIQRDAAGNASHSIA